LQEDLEGGIGLSVVEPNAKLYRRLRRSPRYPYDVQIQISVFREVDTTRYSGRSCDLSLHGLGSILSGDLHIGEVISVEFSIPFTPQSMKLRAVVRHKKGLQYGVEFLVVDDEQKEALCRVCAMLANASTTNLSSLP
jgi:c-di-GMP-binding flagellar brake protein YcgR